MMPSRRLLALCCVLLSPGWLARAQVPALINYQGRILVGGAPFEGSGQFKFALVNHDGSATYWRNAPDQNSDGQPDSALSLTLVHGLYSVILGDTSLPGMSALPVGVFTNSAVYLRVWFNDGVNGFQVLSPDQRLTSVGYALVAASVPDGAITLAKLAPGTLTAGNLTGTLAAGQIPGLDASKIVGGALAPARLPANVAYKDTDLLTTSNALSGQLAVLSGQLASMTAQVQALSTGLQTVTASGYTLVSPSAADTNLTSRGLALFMKVPAPPWTAGGSLGMPAARLGHAAVWTGQSYLIWGGSDGGLTLFGTGAMYDPVQDAWTAVSTLHAPSARAGHTAVWTGQEMIVWGGGDADGFAGTGARFRPDTQNWTPLSTTGPPAGRDGHVSVWTGRQMLVFAGRNTSGLLNDGALYDPGGDTWSTLTVATPPAARHRATAVWAGDRVLVWGGEGVAGALNTGGQLLFDGSGKPTSWHATAVANAPGARSGHTAIWTGSLMIVWGGESNGTRFADGAAYDPVADSWTPLPALGAPSARNDHSALWTGREMLVLGGEDASGALASGAAYDPVSGRWRVLSGAGNPQPRSQATAAWTGTEVLVFGGRAGGTALAALQRLAPQPDWYFYRKP